MDVEDEKKNVRKLREMATAKLQPYFLGIPKIKTRSDFRLEELRQDFEAAKGRAPADFYELISWYMAQVRQH